MCNEEIIKHMEEDMTFRGLAERTKQSYIYRVRKYMEFHKGKNIEELTEDDIQEMVENGEMLLINVQLHKNRRTMKASCQIQATPKFNYYEE